MYANEPKMKKTFGNALEFLSLSSSPLCEYNINFNQNNLKLELVCYLVDIVQQILYIT